MKKPRCQYLIKFAAGGACAYPRLCNAAYGNLPKVRGSQTAAQYGYGRGLSAHKKVNKYQTKANAGKR